MIFSQVTLQVETTVKKKNGAEDNVIKPITLPAVKQRISQLRLDEFSMIGLGKNVRYELNGIGEMEDLIFNYFLDEKGKQQVEKDKVVISVLPVIQIRM